MTSRTTQRRATTDRKLKDRRAAILRRTATTVSPWVCLVEKEVRFRDERGRQLYHCFAQADYVAVLAYTRSGLIPLVRQYRPAVERDTWELPAGLVERGESPEAACRRELQEETGLLADTVVPLGAYDADPGRLENRIHVFFVRASDPPARFTPEESLSVKFVTPKTLGRYVLTGAFSNQLHVAVLALLSLREPSWQWC